MFRRGRQRQSDDAATAVEELIGTLSMSFLMARTGGYDPVVDDRLMAGAAEARQLLGLVAAGPGGGARARRAVETGLTRATIGLQAKPFRKDIKRVYGRRGDWRVAVDDYGNWVQEHITAGLAG